MDTVPNGNVEQKFQEMLAKLTAAPAWSEKQQLELEMARDISTEMLRLAEIMRDGSVDMETCLTMLKYAKVLDFVMTTLASRRDIKPQTLRVIFKLAGLKVDEAYPARTPAQSHAQRERLSAARTDHAHAVRGARDRALRARGFDGWRAFMK